ncbi:TIGR02206 family membrane protein [Radiobacillus kanasensis]|uniref:YwaF family protein n=1 Tax=Radiobacillus kanasensis TaxID=2844358 RepID=UPI001E2F25EA|nr:TIGR02206 family membrane protein [Radiobacillus kanasensis]UFU00638.1 TIGR02206 family membrane protein [Radiobacillus kanasensis]
MSTWFGPSIHQTFTPFSPSHLIMLAIYVVGVLFMIIYYREINLQLKLYQTLRWGLFALLITSELTYQVWAAVNDVWNFRDHMPLHLCGIASITAMFALYTKNSKLIAITFFIGIVPAFLALITPELPYGYDHYRFWKFFIHHIVISWSGLFLVLTSTVRITLRSVLSSYVYLLVYAFVIGVYVNPALESNYLYLSNKPTASTPLDLLGSGLVYYFNLCLLALVVFLLLYGVYTIFQKKTRA